MPELRLVLQALPCARIRHNKVRKFGLSKHRHNLKLNGMSRHLQRITESLVHGQTLLELNALASNRGPEFNSPTCSKLGECYSIDKSLFNELSYPMIYSADSTAHPLSNQFLVDRHLIEAKRITTAKLL